MLGSKGQFEGAIALCENVGRNLSRDLEGECSLPSLVHSDGEGAG
jgi:hypothetical protein